jgi:predicted ABC-type ATPase
VAGATFRLRGADYFNPDEAAATIRRLRPDLSQTQANSAAWQQGKRLLEEAISHRQDYAMETTLGGRSIPSLIAQAAKTGFEVRIWFAALASPEHHIERVRQRVANGGHDIPEADIRRRYDSSRLNLIELMPHLAELRVFDNSFDAAPAIGKAPRPRMVLQVRGGYIVEPIDLSTTPQWAKPIVAAALSIRI